MPTMVGEIITFRALPVGAHFMCNGNRCIKQSTSTATLVDYNRTFYFHKVEVVSIGWAGEE
jgi:hypothetical protein